MIDLNLYPKIQLDIQSKTTTISPLIVIDPENNPIYIAQNKGLFDGDKFFEDYNLKVDSIKESINLQKRIFQIGNVSLTLSNLNSSRNAPFSDIVTERGLVNKYVDIYYKTQSCTQLADCIHAFSGTIIRRCYRG